MADDLERAILLAYDPDAAVDPAVKAQAIAFCDCARREPPSSLLRLCLERLPRASLPDPVRFWLLSALHEAVLSLPPSELPFFLSSLPALASCLSSSPPFIKNKLSQCLSTVITLHYPHSWPTPFVDLLPRLADGPHAVDMFLRLLSSLDDDLLSQDYPRDAAATAAASRVKDAMRMQCVPQIARAWFDVITLYRTSEPSLSASALDVARRYIPWIDIGLVANDVFLQLLFELVESSEEQLRSAAAACLLAIVAKRMDPRPKLALLRSLQFNRLFSRQDSVCSLAHLITGYAVEALECYKRMGSDNVDGSSALELLDEALPSVFYVMQTCQEVDSGNIVEFLSSYVSAMKTPTQKQLVYIGQVLEVVKDQMLYDPAYRSNLDLPDKIGKEEEDEMAESRKDLFALFRSVSRVAPDITLLFMQNLLARAVQSAEMNVEEVEAALSLFYRFGETVSDEAMRTGSGLLGELVPMLLSARFSCHSHRIVALVYLDTITRYMKFVHENTQYIPFALAAFLDERGIHHPHLSVSQRASYLFMRAVKLLKSKLVPFVEQILQSLQDTVARFTTLDWTSKQLKTSGSEDGSYTFEAIGLLIGMEDISPEKQSEYLAALLTPLLQQVDSLIADSKLQNIEESSPRIASVQQTIMAINALSKGFNERLVTTSRPAIGSMFKQTLSVLLQILVVFPNIEPLRNKVTSFLHRMVDILGASILPFLPMALKQLLMDSEPKEMVDFLVLINQLISKFNISIAGMLGDIFPTIVSRVFQLLPSDAFSFDPGYNTEEVRELQELQRVLYTFLHVMATHELSSVLLAPTCREYLNSIIELLLITSCNHKDILVRKQCVQIFVRLIKDWCKKYNGEDKLPGFRNFIIETFATRCCLNSVLDKSFEFRDANTLLLFVEIVGAQKVMYDMFGDEFAVHFVSKGLPAAHCPQDLAEQYYRKLQQDNDTKALRSFYQSLIENLRQQQNGSFVFR
ncbi:exportin-T protein [Dioscorea alata]|uniref:Exportin-T protein n=1 Tax=Dioscorea alata TaxID=55571 RepID=A0ACB7U4Z5_DIOAL|nr:exportin-T protein [Dioscorea alata]